jgi:serine/threonine protein kinase/tetratricopeptide (TPR) repeat protein
LAHSGASADQPRRPLAASHETPDALVSVGHKDACVRIEANRQLLHYRLVERIGEGGMGVVWRAIDTTLDREVAIKILPAELADDAERLERFEREAKLLASVHHPNIAVVFGLHEADGVRFLAMEMVPGDDLSARLLRGSLPLEESLRIGLRIAKALQAAHGQSVIHRDLKPANIRLLPGGEVKVLDFGLAKELPGAKDSDPNAVTHTSAPTELGTLLGTPGYMSPEQARGQTADARADIWALGCILYEMLSGKSPYTGNTVPDTLASVLREEPPALPQSTPPDVRAMVRHCLVKSRDARLDDVSEVRRVLEQALAAMASGREPSAPGQDSAASRKTRPLQLVVAGLVVVAAAFGAWWFFPRSEQPIARPGLSEIERQSVAVLPFENMSADPDGEIFTAGIHDDILTQLAKIGDLKTISRTSVLEYMNSPKSIPKIGRELAVASIVEGGVRRAGDMVRINVKLIDAASEESLWAETYDRELTAQNIFAIQTEIATEIAAALKATLSPAEKERLESAPTENLAAYDAYVRGTELLKRPSALQEDLYAAERHLLQAIELDPGFALAYARLSLAYNELYWLGGEPTTARLEQAFESARKAVELGPDRGESHLALGECFYVSRDYVRAIAEFALAEEMLPGHVEVAHAQAYVTRRARGFAESLPFFERTLELDPRDAQTWANLGLTHAYLGHYEDADRYYQKTLDIAPDYAEAQLIAAINRCNRTATVEFCRRQISPLDPLALSQYQQTGFAWRLALQARAYDKAFDLLEPLDEMHAYQEYTYPKSLLLAITHELTGNADAAAKAYLSAAALLEPMIEERPDYAPHRSALGLAYAGLGRADEGVREGLRAVELMPFERDGFVGSWQLGDLGFIYLRVGDNSAALEAFERYLAHPAMFSARALALDLRLEPLLDEPRFKALLED